MPNGGPYNYHSVPNNTDYDLVQEWVVDKLHLADGSLSLASHLAGQPEEDYTRTSLENTLNRYLTTPITGSYKQQVPTYGFVLRSQLLVQFPDLAVSAACGEAKTQEDRDNAKLAAPILVQRRLAADTMLVLFGMTPPDLVELKLTLPAHQQAFIAAFYFMENSDEVEMHYKRVYASGPHQSLPVDQMKRREPLPVPVKCCKFPRSEIFDWEARTMKVQEYADRVQYNLEKYISDGQYLPTLPTPAVLALQLNEPIYTLSVPAELPKPITKSMHSQTLPMPTNREEANQWNLLHPEGSEIFQFRPPAFPSEKYKPRLPLQLPDKAALCQPTKLPLCPNTTQQRRDKGWADDADRINANELSPALRIPNPLPDVVVHPLNVKVFPLGKPLSDVPTNKHGDLIFAICTKPELKYCQLRVKHFDLKIPIAAYRDPPTTPQPDPNNNQTSHALWRSIAPEGTAPPHAL
ncbi:hypothetical protein NM208_g168 [Fusarium decemcellulare]|uniref:Uncharacterized protein n=1 Tax=Fusarium decemcellulare TaxID=57161 RepID=A0ACC1T088_9HYPO|nr:hypothetical protein NM208_g168 [Fusarium decemcellulare]